MTHRLHFYKSNVFIAFVIPVVAILLLSFSPAHQKNAFQAQKSVTDTIPAIAGKSNDSNNLASEGSLGLRKTSPPDSSKVSENLEASYPEGSNGWLRYLVSEFRYPEKAQHEKIEGKVLLHFTVDEKGRVSNIEALTGDPILQKEAKRVLKNSGRWIPASENGKPIISGKYQAITFRLEPNEAVQQPSVPASDSSAIYKSVDVESTFPGGPSGWLRYLNRTFQYPKEAQFGRIEGTVIAQFIVDEKGRVSNIEAISGPLFGGLREEVIRVIRLSGKWTPALKDGIPVKSYKRQPLTFKLER